MRFFFALALFTCGPNFVLGQTMASVELLKKSISYHDPEDKWGGLHILFDFKEARPDQANRNTLVELNQKTGYFNALRMVDGQALEYIMENGVCKQGLNFKYDLTADQKEKSGLTCSRTETLRNYYTYIWGLPMKLRDPGAILSEMAIQENFMGRNCWMLKVTYDPSVGSDVWYFYFDTQAFALIGYKFYHDEAANDGEYITLQESMNVGLMKFPKIRRWYRNSDDQYLGDDTLENCRLIRGI